MPNNHLYFNHCVYTLGYKVYYLGENILIYDIYIYYVARTFCVIFKYICRFIIWAKIYWYMMWYKIIDGHRHFQGKIHIMLLVTCVWYSGISVFLLSVSCICICWFICCYPNGIIYVLHLAKCNVDNTAQLGWIFDRIKWACWSIFIWSRKKDSVVENCYTCPKRLYMGI